METRGLSIFKVRAHLDSRLYCHNPLKILCINQPFVSEFCLEVHKTRMN